MDWVQTNSFLSVSPLRIAGALFVAAGLCGLLYYGLVFDASVAIPRIDVAGASFGGGRINNFALMQQKSNGTMLSFGAFALGVILYAMDYMRAKSN